MKKFLKWWYEVAQDAYRMQGQRARMFGNEPRAIRAEARVQQYIRKGSNQ